MDWIKKNVDQFALALLALVLLVLSVFVFLKTQSFGESFADALKKAVPNRDIQKVDTSRIDDAQQKLTTPTTWAPAPEKGSLFVSWKLIVDENGKLVRAEQSSSGRIPNAWLLKYELDILSPTVGEDDPDRDGFTNLDEYLGPDRSDANGDKDSTHPKDKDSHPPYYTRLFLKEYITVPFRLLFNAYDGDPKRDKPETMEFQINTVDLRQPSEFLKLGATVANTKFKLIKFEYKTKRNESIQEDEDASELTVQNSDTQESIVLVYRKEADSPDSFALFSYLWPDFRNPQEFKVKKRQQFALKPNVKELYKLVDINKSGAQIEFPNGEKYPVPPLPTK